MSDRHGTGPCSKSTTRTYDLCADPTCRYSVTSSAHRVPIYSINRSIPATAARLRLLEEHGEPIAPITHPAEFALEGEDEYAESMKRKGAREPVE